MGWSGSSEICLILLGHCIIPVLFPFPCHSSAAEENQEFLAFYSCWVCQLTISLQNGHVMFNESVLFHSYIPVKLPCMCILSSYVVNTRVRGNWFFILVIELKKGLWQSSTENYRCLILGIYKKIHTYIEK